MRRQGMIFFALFWSAITLLFDFFIGRSFWDQHRAESFATGRGRVTHSDIHQSSDSDGTTYRPEIRYTYVVKDAPYEGTRFKFQTWSSSDYSYAKKIVRDHPPGSSVTVYYNPARPEEAVLQPHIGGQEYFMLIFLLPFNLVMLGLWWGMLASLFPTPSDSPGGFEVEEKPGQVRVRLSTLPPLGAASLAAFVLSFMAIFFIGFTTGFSISTTGFLTFLITLLVVAFCAYVWQDYRIDSGVYDLVLNRANQTVHIPATFKRSAQSIPFASITDVGLLINDADEGTTSYCLILYWVDEIGARQESRLVEIRNDQDKAEALRRWLRIQLPLQSS